MSAHLDADRLGELHDAAPDDPRRRHLLECARCRALMRAHDDFVGDLSAPAGARLVEAERALGAFLEREIGHWRPAPASARPAWIEWLWTPAARPAWAFACAAVIAGGTLLVIQARGPSPVVLRGAPPVAPGSELELLAPEFEGDAVMLHWRPAQEADAYLVRFFSEGLEEIGRAGPTPEPSITVRLSEAAPGAGRGEAVLYRVVALARGDEVGTSALGTLRVR